MFSDGYIGSTPKEISGLLDRHVRVARGDIQVSVCIRGGLRKGHREPRHAAGMGMTSENGIVKPIWGPIWKPGYEDVAKLDNASVSPSP